jgi:PAN domain
MDSTQAAIARWMLACATALQPWLSSAQSLELEHDRNRPGTDYQRIELAVADPEICQSHCVADTQCRAFSYVKPGVQGAAAVCYLKSGTPAPETDACCISGLRSEVTPAHARSLLFQSHQTWQARARTRASVDGVSDTLAQYAAKCDAATTITVPPFSCSNGTEVPGQGQGGRCDRPNVLNGACDPGSKFQVLPGGNADAVAVAHCRRVGLPANGNTFNDIAVIQHNKKNGATCFYQALTNLPGDNIPAPAAGELAHWADGQGHWISPKGTEGIGCTGCHDSGGFIRSEYLAQMKTPPNALPSTAAGFNNQTTLLRYVGRDFATNRSWSITTANAPGDNGLSCTACHRLAVPNRLAFGIINGTAAHFANIATAATQLSKNPHGANSPIWMRPGQITYNALAEATASKFRNCATTFFNSNFVTVAAGCSVTPLGQPWTPPVQPPSPQRQQCLKDCADERNACMADVPHPGGPRPQQCVAEFKACNAACPSP